MDASHVEVEPPEGELSRLVAQIADEAREHIKRLKASREYIGHHFNFPKLGYFDSGFPRVSRTSVQSAPVDYGSPFGPKKGQFKKVAYDELPSLLSLFDYVRERTDLKSRLGTLEVPDNEDATEQFMQITIAAKVLDVFDHVMHVAGEAFGEDELKAAWLPIERGLTAELLPIEIHVPIVLTHFNTTVRVELGRDLSIEPIPDDLQLARIPDISWGSAVHSTVLAAATHSFVFSRYAMPKMDPRGRQAHLPGFHPLDRIDMAFAALRLVTGIECGYAHTFLKPIGWSPGYDGRLARIVPGAIIRRYPTSFDNWGWLVERSPVSDSQLAEVRHALSQLDAAPSNLQLAARRLSAAMLREDEEDAVIDVCIGLEAALGDESTTEMTHKLALRTAAVIAAAGADAAHDPLKTFNRTKRLYAWRSKLVHGGMGAKKAREKLEQLADGEPGLAIAVRLLRDGLGAVLARPNLQSSRAVDEELILAGLAQPEDSETA